MMIAIVTKTNGNRDVRPAVGVAFEKRSFLLRPMTDSHATTFALKLPTKPPIKDYDVSRWRVMTNIAVKLEETNERIVWQAAAE